MNWVRYGLPFALGLALAHFYHLAAARAIETKAANLSTQQAREQRDLMAQQVSETERRRFLLGAHLLQVKTHEDDRDSRIDSGVERVYVRASCPSLPAVTPDAGGTGGGAAELDPAYRKTLSDLRRGAEEQLALLNFCRAELRARSLGDGG